MFRYTQIFKKGTLLFIASKKIKTGNIDEEYTFDNDYTMHVLYVNNNWCFDTYSQRQYPLGEVLKRFQSKTYKFFTYEDIARKTYKEFRKEHAPELKE